jgi:cytochrome c biogenesis protein CcmG/thiol:disulfide interchange protein DsbE|tara:strand:+ start:471 stop:992 length:522 start_codon:yes stop_codon:yes gene_type:complete
MKNKILIILIIFFFIFCFIVLFKGLNNSNIYIPKLKSEKLLINFKSKELFSEIEISSDKLFIDSDFYILNIWSSWCLPCRDEHKFLMQLNKNSSLMIVGLNYKDKSINAKKFLNELGNPYSTILLDTDGTISIELGAYGVPETFLINDEKKIIKKIIGPINEQLINEINLMIK